MSEQIIDMRLPAFPFQCQGPATAPEFYYGFTRQEYAAIQLRQPTSGTPWLDEMILAAKRDELAGQLIGHLYTTAPKSITNQNLASESYAMAGSILAARKENK